MLHGDVADLSTRTLMRGAEPAVRLIAEYGDGILSVDITDSFGKSSRTVSEQECSSTKIQLLGD